MIILTLQPKSDSLFIHYTIAHKISGEGSLDLNEMIVTLSYYSMIIYEKIAF